MKSLNRFVTAMAASAVVMAGTLSAPQQVQAAGSDPNTGDITVEAGVDFTTAYFFRGIMQENDGLISQPWINLKANVFHGDDSSVVKNVTIWSGIWNSFHENKTYSSNHYEEDFIVGVSAEFGKFTGAVSQIWYTYPDTGGALTYQEVDFRVSYNDAGVWGNVMGTELSLQPYFLVAIEHGGAGSSDGGSKRGVYFELGVSPSFVIGDLMGKEYPITVTIPLVVGLGSDYYQVGSNDDEFGFFSAGVKVSVPLAFIPSSLGNWTAYAGVTFLFLGDNASILSSGPGTGDDFEVVGTVGVAMGY